MDAIGKARLKSNLGERVRQARDEELQVEIDITLWTAAVELWSTLDVPEEHGGAAAVLAVKQERQKQLQALIDRLQRGIEFLNR